MVRQTVVSDTRPGLAALAYLTSVVGAAFILLFNKDDSFARFHAYQSLGIAIIAVGLFVAWTVVGLILALIPFYGMIILSVGYALVLGFELLLFVSLLSGILYSLGNKRKRVLFVGGMIESMMLRIKID